MARRLPTSLAIAYVRNILAGMRILPAPPPLSLSHTHTHTPSSPPFLSVQIDEARTRLQEKEAALRDTLRAEYGFSQDAVGGDDDWNDVFTADIREQNDVEGRGPRSARAMLRLAVGDVGWVNVTLEDRLTAVDILREVLETGEVGEGLAIDTHAYRGSNVKRRSARRAALAEARESHSLAEAGRAAVRILPHCGNAWYTMRTNVRATVVLKLQTMIRAEWRRRDQVARAAENARLDAASGRARGSADAAARESAMEKEDYLAGGGYRSTGASAKGGHDAGEGIGLRREALDLSQFEWCVHTHLLE